MRKWSSVIIGLVLVAACCIGFVQYMKSYQLDVTMMETVKPVEMIQAGELITADMLIVVSIPTVQHMENAITDGNQIVGKRAIVPIGETEEFLSWKIGEDTLYPKDGETYIGFKVDFVGAVNNMIRRGDKVDVWVEYTEPKLLDAAGQVIDSTGQAITTEPNSPIPKVVKKIYNERLIPGLTVAYVKDQDGKEIVDVPTQNSLGLPLSPGQRDEENMERYRQNASAQPAYITFIINEEQYARFTEGEKQGVIKLGLPGSSQSVGTIVPPTPEDSETNAKTQESNQDNNEQDDASVDQPVSEAKATNNAGGTEK